MTDDTESASHDGGLQVARRGHVLTLEIDNPSRANALTASILDDLQSALAAEAVTDARVVILIGSGDRHFSSGVDLSGIAVEELPAHIQVEEARLGRAALAVEACPVPVIAAINGAAFGGALELAAACDWRIAAAGAHLGMPAARLGVAYSLPGLERFVRLLGPARTRRVFLSGTPIGAEEGFALGLVDQVVSVGSLRDAVEEEARAVASASPMAIRATRATISSLVQSDHGGAARQADARRAEIFASADFREGLAAFREKRTPRFGGD